MPFASNVACGPDEPQSGTSVAAPARCEAPPTQLDVPIIRHARARNATLQVRLQASSPANTSLAQRRDHSNSVCDAAATPHTPDCCSCISAAARKLVLLMQGLGEHERAQSARSEIFTYTLPARFPTKSGGAQLRMDRTAPDCNVNSCSTSREWLRRNARRRRCRTPGAAYTFLCMPSAVRSYEYRLARLLRS